MPDIAQTQFNEILKRMSKVYLRIIIPNIGLKRKYETVLTLLYIEELSHAEIAEKLNMTRESVSNLAIIARKELKRLVDKKDLMPENIKPYLDIFDKN